MTAGPRRRLRVTLWQLPETRSTYSSWLSLYPLDASVWTRPIVSARLADDQEIPVDLPRGGEADIEGDLREGGRLRVTAGGVCITPVAAAVRRVPPGWGAGDAAPAFGEGAQFPLHGRLVDAWRPDGRRRPRHLLGGATSTGTLALFAVMTAASAVLLVALRALEFLGPLVVSGGSLAAGATARLRRWAGIRGARRGPWREYDAVAWWAPSRDGGLRAFLSLYRPGAAAVEPLATVPLLDPLPLPRPLVHRVRVRGAPRPGGWVVVDEGSGAPLEPVGPCLGGLRPSRLPTRASA